VPAPRPASTRRSRDSSPAQRRARIRPLARPLELRSVARARDNQPMRKTRLVRPLALAVVLGFALPAAAQKIEWFQKDLNAALESSKNSKAGMVLLYCWREDHPACKDMFSLTIEQDAVQKELSQFLCLSAKKDQPDGRDVQAKFGVETLPTILFLQPDGAVVDVLSGYLDQKPFLAEVARVRAGKDTITSLRAAVAAKPDDLAQQLVLAKKLKLCGDQRGAAAALADIVKRDPKGAAEPAAEAQLLQVTAKVIRPELAPKDIDLKPLKDFLIPMKHKRILFLGYDRIAAVEYSRQNLKAAIEAADRAWKNIPQDQILAWGQNIAAKAYAHKKDLDKATLKKALEVSERALKVAQDLRAERGNEFLANALYLHAAVQIINNLRKEAFATMQSAIEYDPKNENLKNALKMWQEGSK
jgi:hypothetical protein